MLTATLGLFRPLVASVAGSSRAFSTSPVVEVLKTHSGAKKRWRVTGSGLVSSALALSFQADMFPVQAR